MHTVVIYTVFYVAIYTLDVLVSFAFILLLDFFHTTSLFRGFFSAYCIVPSKTDFIPTNGRKNMALYAISDLHLSTLESTNKSMEVFGHRWDGYIDRLKNNWERLVEPEDTVIIPGDVSWALSLEEAESDLKFLDNLPGKKIIGKGNHDFWWATMSKHTTFFKKLEISSISFLFNNAHLCGDFIIAGTRGWYMDEEAKNAPDNTDFEKLVNREKIRLEMSLKEAKKIKCEHPGAEILAFMHFPPFWNGKSSEPLVNLLKEYGVKRVYFGHIHGNYTVEPHFTYDGIEMTIISADYLQFIPKRII